MQSPPQTPFLRYPFSEEEDDLLKSLVSELGDRDWVSISSRMPGRKVRQCRERWNHYLCPALVHRKWSKDEEARLENCVREFGRKWKTFEPLFPGRTDIDIKNHYNVILRRHKREMRLVANLAVNQATSKKASQPSQAVDPMPIPTYFHLSLTSDADDGPCIDEDSWDTC